LIAAEKIGRETVTYVSNISKYYVTCSLVQEQRLEQKRANSEVMGAEGSEK
jgi:hypothetical protein